MGGQAGIRGYLVQTITCLLQALSDDTWLTLALEPHEELEQVDIRWTYADGRKKVVQIKSSKNQIGAKDIENWAAQLELAQADDYELQVIGPCSRAVTDNPMVGKVRIPTPLPLELGTLLRSTAQLLDEYLHVIGISGTGPTQRRLLVEAFMTELTTGSATGVSRSRQEFDHWLRDRLQLLVAEVTSKSKESAVFEGPGAVPALKVPHFMGRQEKLQVLRDVLASNAEAVCVVMTGLGGTGKTALVQQFVATEAPGLFPEGVLWLDGTDLIRELTRGAARFGLRIDQSTPPEEISRQLTHELHLRRVLVVVDNVEREKVPLTLLPIPGGLCKTVLTTRIGSLHADLGKPSELLRLGSWDAESCRSYFRRVAPVVQNSPDQQLDALSSFVGGLPLAVRLLAKLLIRPGNTPKKLLARLKQEPVRTLDLAAQGADRSIVATLLVALKDLPQEQLRVLIATAACARATRDCVVGSVAGLDENAVTAALAELADRSLVDFIEGANYPWSMHDIVRLLARLHPAFHQAALPRHGLYVLTRAKSFAARIRQRVVSESPGTVPSEADEEKDVPEFLAAIDNHLASGNGRFALMMLEPAAEFLFGRVSYASLKSRVEEAIQLFRPGSPEIAGLLCWLGQCCFHLGDVHEAIKHLNLAVDLARKHSLGEDEAHAHGHLGYCFRLLGDIPRGIAHLEQTLQISERLGNLSQQSVALAGIANCYRTLHDMPKALETLSRALAIAQRLEDPRAEVNAWLYMGHCYSEQGELHQAVEAYDRVVSMPAGFDIATLAAALAGLAVCHGRLGNTAKAKEFNERALEINQRIDRVEGQSIALMNRGMLSDPTQSRQQEIEDLKRSLEFCEKSGSLEGQSQALSRLSEVYAELGHIEDAIRFEERSLVVLEKRQIPELQCGSLIRLGGYHLECGDDEKGLDYYEKALRLSERHQLLECQAAVVEELGGHFLSSHELPRATSYLERALKAYDAVSDAEGQSRVLMSLAECAHEVGDLQRSRTYLERLLPIAQEGGAGAELLADLGIVHLHLGELPKAADYLKRSLAAFDGEHSDKKFHILMNLGRCFYLMNQFQDALESLSEALMLSHQFQSPANQAMCLSAVGDCHYALGEQSKARDRYLQLLSLGEEAVPVDSQCSNLLQLARCCVGLDDAAAALAYAERALVLGQQHRDPAMQASAYNVMGACHLAAKNPATALEPLGRALDLEKTLGREREKAQVLANIGICHKELGDRSQAIVHLKQAVACFHRAGDIASEQQLRALLNDVLQ